MNLTGKNEDVITVDGRAYELDLAFPNVLEAFKIVRDDGLAASERIALCLRLLLRKTPQTPLDALVAQRLLQTIFDEKIDLAENRLAAQLFGTKGKTFDFDIDADRIAASFMQQYRIDLGNARERHAVSWAFFNALLSGLGPDTPFRQATAYRVMEIPDDATPEQKEHIRKMKKLYSLTSTTSGIESKMAGMDRVQRIKYLAEQMKKESEARG
ncbi:Gp15 family bacteriophage protein [Lacticaseibacillus absianus]|uniref:Gp15 family bacteriophage protein n=1 Tax=Lacticaseibacillus absianus TaxID=2729623 RepID=UPI0015CAFE0E|nr:Gp15 family bacteriophage protein [Lacticaseibacillus absianus]